MTGSNCTIRSWYILSHLLQRREVLLGSVEMWAKPDLIWMLKHEIACEAWVMRLERVQVGLTEHRKTYSSCKCMLLSVLLAFVFVFQNTGNDCAPNSYLSVSQYVWRGAGGQGEWPTCLVQDSIIWDFLCFSEYLRVFPGPKEVM